MILFIILICAFVVISAIIFLKRKRHYKFSPYLLSRRALPPADKKVYFNNDALQYVIGFCASNGTVWIHIAHRSGAEGEFFRFSAESFYINVKVENSTNVVEQKAWTETHLVAVRDMQGNQSVGTMTGKHHPGYRHEFASRQYFLSIHVELTNVYEFPSIEVPVPIGDRSMNQLEFPLRSVKSRQRWLIAKNLEIYNPSSGDLEAVAKFKSCV